MTGTLWPTPFAGNAWKRCRACANRNVARPVVRAVRRASTCSMEVPSDSFGGQSPERKAAAALRTLFTFCAVKIVLAQLTGSGRGGLGSYNSQQHTDLMAYLEEEALRDGDAWLKGLLKRNEMLGAHQWLLNAALRVMEVRQAYACESFEWDQLRRLVERDGQAANVMLLRGQAEEAFLREGAPGSADSNPGSS